MITQDAGRADQSAVQRRSVWGVALLGLVCGLWTRRTRSGVALAHNTARGAARGAGRGEARRRAGAGAECGEQSGARGGHLTSAVCV